MKNKKYDVVVVGAGSGGLTSAVGLAKLGKKVLLIERDKMGGECTNSGCVPSKALIHYANEYRTSSKIAGQNAATEEYRKGAFDYVRSKINEILAEETSEHFNKLGIDVIFGEAVFTGKKSLKVDEETIEFKKAIIATGSSPRPLSVPGLT
jgi:pyruvate/2-oxoglutarate dehydrogenase complex dihydrolipoamide dehydrogenase (E3) component